MASGKSNDQRGEHKFIFWITLFRGILALALGFALLLIPEKTYVMLYNFMGMFWLMSGLVLVRQETRLKRSRLFLILGILGMITGLVVLTRYLTSSWLGESLIINLMGAVILITGVLHVLGGFQFGKRAMLGRTGISTLLGVFEVVLGGLVLFSHTGTSQVVFIFATIWALLGGGLLLMDAFNKRRQMKSAG